MNLEKSDDEFRAHEKKKRNGISESKSKSKSKKNIVQVKYAGSSTNESSESSSLSYANLKYRRGKIITTWKKEMDMNFFF